MNNVRIFVAIVLVSMPAAATVQRTFVSSTGSDANNCQRDHPCRNFTAAIAQTSAGGEVVALDSAGYGPIPSIDRSISIIAPLGVHAAITATSGATAVVINAPGASIVLRNLYLTGLGGSYGISLIDASSVVIENTQATGFDFIGLVIDTASTCEITVQDSVFRNSGGSGVSAIADNGFLALVGFNRCRFENNAFNGVAAGVNSRVMVRDSTATGNSTGFGLVTFVVGAFVRMDLDSCNASHNTIGLGATPYSTPADGILRVSNSSITGNGTGVATTAPFVILSQGNNTLEDNDTNGAFTSTYAPK